MVKKISKKTRPSRTSAAPAGSVKDSAQQIWQAGLGAFTRAQAEGSKAFESLVKEGMSIQRKTQAAAEEKISEATARVSSMATDITTKATGQWDKLESIFEERVAKALNKLGVPSAKEVNALISRVAVLEKAAQQGVRKTTSSSAPKATAKPTAKVTQKAVAKPAAKPVAAKPKAKAAPAAAQKKPAPQATPAKAAKPATSATKAAATPAAPAPTAVRADVPTAATA